MKLGKATAAALGAAVLAGGALAVLGGRWVRRGPAAERLSFNEDVQPILSQHCFQCHGPDPGTRKGELRLDRPEYAFLPHKEGVVIARGDPDHSLLVQRVESARPKELMPPPEEHNGLNPGEVAVLRRWIKEGAEYQEHWAYVKPVSPPLPATKRRDWGNNAIDRFILARLEQAGLTPSPEADKYALLRRVTFDLSGLPPTPEEVGAFVADASPNAYEKAVDRLLASPRYGEQRAHYWLDAVRYGDTNGEHADKYRLSWPYRDYVIRSFNENKPFDRFTLEQLAGDLYPARDLDQLIATEFNRLNTTTNEGGSQIDLVNLNKVKDRAQTVAAVFMGETMGCAACHDHKFDPITQKDFYSLTAFFNNMTDSAYDGNEVASLPTLPIPRPEKLPDVNRVLAARAAVQGELDERQEKSAQLLQAWLAGGGAARLHPVSKEKLTAWFPLNENQGSVVHNRAAGAEPATYTLAPGIPGWGNSTRPVKYWTGLMFDVPTRLQAGGIGDFDRGDAFTAGGWFLPRERNGTPKGALLSRMSMADKNRGWDLYWQAAGRVRDPDRDDDADKQAVEKPGARKAANGQVGRKIKVVNAPAIREPGRVVVDLISEDKVNAIKVQSKAILGRDNWVHLAFTYDGSGKAAGVHLYVNGERQEVVVLQDALTGTLRTSAPFQFGRRANGDMAVETGYQDVRVYARALSDAEVRSMSQEDVACEILRRPAGEWNEDERKVVTDFFFQTIDAPSIRLRAQLARLDKELAAVLAGGVQTPIAQERESLPTAFVLGRGAFDALEERVDANVPAVLPPLPPGVPHNRLGLAKWLVSPENPLTARVTVNRMWQELFGAGLVETPQDFGTVGARPTDRPLLDWLAVDFEQSGWDVKRFYRQVVLSATYRQSAVITPELLAKDPTNRLLGRGPRFRLDAEEIRDEVLDASGLLVEHVGGPSVKPYQAPGIWEAVEVTGQSEPTYVADKGDGLYRRSLYTYWKRQAPNPTLATLDSPDREVCTMRRERTDTPLQALVVENAPDFLEAARHLAARTLAQSDSGSEQKINSMALQLFDRPLPAAQQAALARSLDRFRRDFARPEDARAFLAVGDSPVEASLPPGELAAWTLLASSLINSDQALNK